MTFKELYTELIFLSIYFYLLHYNFRQFFKHIDEEKEAKEGKNH